MRFLDLSPIGDLRFYGGVLLALGLFAALSVRNSPGAIQGKMTRGWLTWIGCAVALFAVDYAAARLDAPNSAFVVVLVPGVIALCVSAMFMTRKWRSESSD